MKYNKNKCLKVMLLVFTLVPWYMQKKLGEYKDFEIQLDLKEKVDSIFC